MFTERQWLSVNVRVESTKGENQYACWLTPHEVDAFIEAAENRSHKHKVVILLGTKVGLRAKEYTQIRPKSVFREAGKYRITVRGKDTSGELGDEGKRRDAYLPERVERELLELQYSGEIDDDEPYFNVTKTRIRQMVHEAAREAAEMGTGRREDWMKISSHDLRRFYAHNLLVRQRVNPRVVMKNGGWETYSAIEPYLKEPTAENVNDEMARAGLD